MIEVKQAKPTRWTELFSNTYSQFGEDGVLAEIFRRIGTTNKQCFEVGAADGKWFSNSRRLIDEGWSAALIEAEPSNWPELDKLDGGRVYVVHGAAEPSGENSLDSILAKCGFDHAMDLGIIDVDGQDYYLFNGMLKYRPRVMVVEYDPNADQNFVPDLGGTGQAGLAAICSIAISKGYFSVATTETNLIFALETERKRLFSDGADQPVVNESNGNGNGNLRAASPKAPTLATGKEVEIKIAAVLSRPRFGLNVFWDCASEALAPWHIPLQSFYGVFWGQCLERAMEDNIAAGIDWILTLDYDTLFSSKHMQQLIDALGQNPQIDAICGLQCRRGRPLPLAVRADGAMQMTGGPVQVTTAHFGLTLFRAEAIKRMKQKPWFWSKPAPSGTWGEGRLDDDIYFWGQWRDAGNTLFVHTGCRIGHVEEMVTEFQGDGTQRHVYLSDWRRANGHTIKTFE